MARRMLSLKVICFETGLSKATIYRLMAKGEFPQSVRLSDRRVAWPSDEVSVWLQARMAERRDPVDAD